MHLRDLILGLVLSAACLSTADAAVITFQGGDVYSSGEYLIANNGPHGVQDFGVFPSTVFGWCAADCTNTVPQVVTLSRADGTAFTITQVDAGPLNGTDGNPLVATGFLSAGGTVTQSLTLASTLGQLTTYALTGFSGVTSVQFTKADAAPGLADVGIDNVHVLHGLYVTPGSIDFGGHAVGTTAPASTASVVNDGPIDVVVSGISAPGAPFSAAAGGNCAPVPFTLIPGASCTLAYAFAPTSAGTVTDTVTITSNDVASPHTLTLSGTGTQPALGLTPASLAFGAHDVGTTSALQGVTVANTGSADLEVSGISAVAAPFVATGGTCAAAPFVLAPGSSCTLEYAFVPTSTGAASGTITITSNAPTSADTIGLSGTGVQGAIDLAPSSVVFGDQAVGTTSGAQTVTVGNTGDGDLTVSAIAAVSAPFVAAAGTCGAAPFTLGPGATCTLAYTFAPTAAGSATDTVTIASNDPASPHAIALSGTGTQATLVLTPASLAFGDQEVGTTSAPQGVTVANTGNADLQVSGISAAAAPFVAAGGSCAAVPFVLTQGTSCTLEFAFAPTTTGATSGSITITSDAPTSADTIALSGTGVQAAINVAPASLDFGDQAVGTTSGEQTVTLGNTGDADLTVSAIAAVGAPFATATGTCGPAPFTLAPGATCTLAYTFAPTAAGAASDTVAITSNDPGSPHAIALSGTGTQPVLVLTPASLGFGDQNVGTISAPQGVTVANTGNADMQVSTISAATAPFAAAGGTCAAVPFVLAQGASCTLEYTFAPTGTGVAMANVEITSDAPDSPATLSLSGTGIVPGIAIDATAIELQAAPDDSESVTITVSNTGAGDLTLTGITPPSPPFALSGGTCLVLPILAPGASCTIEVTFSPSKAGAFADALTIDSNAPSGPATIALEGISILPPVPAPAIIPALDRFGLLLLVMGALVGGWLGLRRAH